MAEHQEARSAAGATGTERRHTRAEPARPSSHEISGFWLRARDTDRDYPAELVVAFTDGSCAVTPIAKARGVPLLKQVVNLMLCSPRVGEEA